MTDKRGQAIITLSQKVDKLGDELLELSEIIIDASLYWTGEDEHKNPKLKTARTLAGLYRDRAKGKTMREVSKASLDRGFSDR